VESDRGPDPAMNSFLNKIQKLRHSPYLTTVFRIILGVIFIYAGLEKIGHADLFAVTIQNYQLVPISMTNLIAIFLPWLELYCGLLLLLGWWQRIAAAWAVLLNIIFLTALISAYWRGLDIVCGCFGSGTTVNMTRILEDLLLLALSLHIFIFPVSALAIENRWSPDGH